MEKNTKIILGVGIAVVVISTGVIVYIKVIKPKMDANKIVKQAKQDLMQQGVSEQQAEQQTQQLKQDIENAVTNPQAVPSPPPAPTINSVVQEANKTETAKNNFESLKTNLGDKAAWKSAYSVGVVAFNGKFVVVFYPNGTLQIYKVGDVKKTILLTAIYQVGGFTIKSLGVNGKEFVGFGSNGVGVMAAVDRLIQSQIKK